MNEAFTFYASFYEAIKNLKKNADRLKLYDAICEYGIEGKMPECEGAAKSIFVLIKPVIDANLAKREAGAKGGKAESKAEAKVKQTASKAEAKEKEPATDIDIDININKDINRDKDIDIDGDIEHECVVTRARTREHTNTGEAEPLVRTPTMEAIMEENHDRGYGLSAESINDFVEYNNGKNWRMDWRKALEKWAAHERQKQSGARSSPYIDAIKNRLQVVDQWLEESG